MLSRRLWGNVCFWFVLVMGLPVWAQQTTPLVVAPAIVEGAQPGDTITAGEGIVTFSRIAGADRPVSGSISLELVPPAGGFTCNGQVCFGPIQSRLRHNLSGFRAAEFRITPANSPGCAGGNASALPVTLSSCTLNFLDRSTEGLYQAHVHLYLFTATAPSVQRELFIDFQFAVQESREDAIRIVASQPESGTTLEAGNPPPFFNLIVYELGTKDEGEVFLEMTWNGTVLGTSNSRRVPRGLGSVGAGEGLDDLLRLDGFLLPDTSGIIEIRAWLAETGGRGRLKSSAPVVYNIRPPTKLTLEIGVVSDAEHPLASFSPLTDLSKEYLLAGHKSPSFFRLTSNGPDDFTQENISLGNFAVSNRPEGGPRFTPLVIEGKVAIFRFSSYEGINPSADQYMFVGRLENPTGQIISSNAIMLDVQSVEVRYPVSPDNGLNRIYQYHEGKITKEEYKAGPSYNSPVYSLTKGQKYSFALPLEIKVRHEGDWLYRCLRTDDPPSPQQCQPVFRPPLGKNPFTDTFELTVTEAIRPDYYIGPAPPPHRETTADYVYGFSGYEVKDPPSILTTGPGALLEQAGALVNKVNNTVERAVTVKKYAETAAWGYDTYKTIFGKDKPNPSDGKRGALADISEVMALNATWRFDPPIPRDGSFSAELTLRYESSDVPDHPGFDPSKIQILSIDPGTGEYERLASQVNVAERTVTARVDRLAPIYGLGVAERPVQVSHAFPTATLGSLRKSGLVVVNAGKDPLPVELMAFTNNTPGQVTKDLGAGAQLSGVPPDLFGVKESDGLNWVQVRAPRNTLAGVHLLTEGKAFEAFPLQRDPARLSLLPRIESSTAVRTEIHIANPANFEVELSVYLFAADGNMLDSTGLKLPSKGKIERTADALFRNAPENFNGYVMVSSAGPVSVGAVQIYRSAMAASAGQAVPAVQGSPTRCYAPLMAAGVRLYMVNTAEERVSMVLRAFRDTGATAGNPVNLSLDPKQQYAGDLGALFGAALPSGVTGWLSIEASHGGLLGEIHFGDNTPAARVRTALPLSRELLAASVIPFAAHNSTTQTTLAVASPNGVTAVRVTVLDAEGKTVGGAISAIPAGGRVAKPLSQWAPDAPTITGGYILISSDRPVSAYALVSPVNGDDYASLPAVAIPTLIEPTPPSAPAISASVSALDFGTVSVGQRKDLTVTLRNTGNAPLTISGITVSNSAVSVSPATPFTLAPDAQQVVTVRYSPASAGSLAATLAIANNDPNRATFNITLTGTATSAPVSSDACPSTTNIARTGTASQSSTDFSGPASLGNNGVVNEPNGYGFHTGFENSPWWQVDLGSVRTICEVRMFNRVDFAARARSIRVRVSTNGTDFETLYTHDGSTWGANGAALTVANPVLNRQARYVRVQLGESDYLHLREVEVYGGNGGGSSGSGPSISLSPASLDFGSVTVGQTKPLDVLVRNTGSSTLQGSALSSSSRFTISPATFSLDAGAQQAITVTFRPDGAGTQSANLTITSNDPARPSVSVPLTGSAVAAPSTTTILQVDDGTYERKLGGISGDLFFINRLTPTKYPATLKAIQIYFHDDGDGLPAGQNITILSAANSTGNPNIDRIPLRGATGQIAAVGRFNEYTIPFVTIQSGDFVVGFSVRNPGGVFPMANDITSSKGRSYLSTDGESFFRLESIDGLTPGNFLIRAVIE